MTNTPKGSRARTFTAQDVETAAAQLKKVALDIDALAKEMAESKFDKTVRIDGGDMVYDATKLALRWYHRICEAYSVASLTEKPNGGDDGDDPKPPKKKK
jgi:hypothetical protein